MFLSAFYLYLFTFFIMGLFEVYSLLDLEPVKAKGAYLWDKNGDKYLDFYGGHAVISIGHSHPVYVEKMTRQLNGSVVIRMR